MPLGPIRSLVSLAGSSFLAIEKALRILDAREVSRHLIVVLDSDVVVLSQVDSPLEREGARLRDEARLTSDELDQEAGTAVDSLPGEHYHPIRVGVDVFRARERPLEAYQIRLLEEGDALFVTFSRRDGGGPGFEVELRASDLEVCRSTFTRNSGEATPRTPSDN